VGDEVAPVKKSVTEPRPEPKSETTEVKEVTPPPCWPGWNGTRNTRARLRRQQGTVMLYFVVNWESHVQNYRIEQSSGYVALKKCRK